MLAAQILLDRAHHSPGVIDGAAGGNTRRSVLAYQKANGLDPTGEVGSALLQRLSANDAGALLKTYTVTEADVAGPFHSVPEGLTAMAELDAVTYESAAEALAEKFHMARSFFEALNPGADFAKAGTRIVIADAGADKLGDAVVDIEVDKDANELRAYAAGKRLVATYPTTVGSSFHPSPDTTVEVTAIASNPTYHFDPEGRDWGPDETLTIAAGPNNPVGSTWIDLSREGYGIHGTPEPRLIGKTSSHGCVRLTNWDAAELARAVERGAKVHFI
ncbi:murein L,D-transpeptidase [Sphingomonas sinipercae]|uniref:Murein L,D-transpeptidase n=1 Tax=Sphingomonas sinipercae TaxID=2714944 RepID=A0A6G7ZR12_9SPHN|nr:murein L,D-transpeptidase [Sphingomonas sinipercae]